MLYQQIIGRGLRTHPGKLDCLVLDHTSSTERLGLVTDIEWRELDDGRPKPPATPRDLEEAKPVECIECHFVKPPKTPTCPNCGFEMKHVSKVVTINGTLREIKGKRAHSRADKQTWWSGFLTYASQRGKSHKWALAQYKTKFGVWPCKLRDVPGPLTDEMRDWIKSRAIAYARSQGLPDHVARRAA
jgi:superfamily II DNA or RNA helicase